MPRSAPHVNRLTGRGPGEKHAVFVGLGGVRLLEHPGPKAVDVARPVVGNLLAYLLGLGHGSTIRKHRIKKASDDDEVRNATGMLCGQPDSCHRGTRVADDGQTLNSKPIEYSDHIGIALV